MLTQHMSQKSTLKFSDFAGLQLVQVTSYTSIDDRNLFLNSHGNCMEKKKHPYHQQFFYHNTSRLCGGFL